MQVITLYTTAGCHLCEQAEELLRQAATVADIQWQSVDIVTEPELMELYGIRIPVLKRQDTGEELGWPFRLEELEGYLQ